MRVQEVADPGHPLLGDYTDLTDVALRSAREPAEGLYIAESAKVIRRALAAGHRPRSVLLEPKWLPDLQPELEPLDVDVLVAAPALVEQVTGYRVHRGALAAMHRPVLADPAVLLADARTVVVLEDIVDHTNVGAVFRSVAGLGADAVLVTPRCADPLYRRSVRVSMGTVFQVPWTRVGDWDETREVLHGAGFELAALALADDAVGLREYARARPERVAILLGAEGDGLSRRAVRAADAVVTIPMAHGVDSLNVAAAGAVALYALSTDGNEPPPARLA
ncbi:rRNA methyltransferase [Agromyces rhizosphaerae]|uniref:rRNA methyltransferase n=1 Tax=Agromyces rhizosphaerae TaxID=88374 RepID=A0A9W6CUW2_9MICO|nr:RNA methyltransferase [Agromyces rhizosphaerae]GLI28903.1 rRNA methyltransferase [Agromyces rhizosphaerae]